MKQRTLTFTKRPKSLDFNNEVGVNIIKVGGHRFTMKNFKNIDGHDDSLPYRATLYVDKQKFAECHNDGWGGDTELEYYDKTFALTIKQIVGQFKWKYSGMSIDLTIPFIADILAYTEDSNIYKN